ncbi:hypothetical protein ACWPKS_13450 [Coraliomargarita sp. W4R72]
MQRKDVGLVHDGNDVWYQCKVAECFSLGFVHLTTQILAGRKTGSKEPRHITPA